MAGSILSFNEQKRSILELLLPLCPFVAIDGTHPAVILPEALRMADLVLRVGRDPKVMGMPDLVLDDAGFSATISMRGMRTYVTVPWAACSRCWVGDPFAGPMVMWPEGAQQAEPDKPKAAGLRLVK